MPAGLNPPIGASPGEMRLWLKMNGLLQNDSVKQAGVQRVGQVGRRVNATKKLPPLSSRRPPLATADTNVPTRQQMPATKPAAASMPEHPVPELADAEPVTEAAEPLGTTEVHTEAVAESMEPDAAPVETVEADAVEAEMVTADRGVTEAELLPDAAVELEAAPDSYDADDFETEPLEES